MFCSFLASAELQELAGVWHCWGSRLPYKQRSPSQDLLPSFLLGPASPLISDVVVYEGECRSSDELAGSQCLLFVVEAFSLFFLSSLGASSPPGEIHELQDPCHLKYIPLGRSWKYACYYNNPCLFWCIQVCCTRKVYNYERISAFLWYFSLAVQGNFSAIER